MCCGEDWAIAELMAADQELKAAVYAIGGHYPASAKSGTGQLFAPYNETGLPTAAALALGVPLWASEDCTILILS